MRRRYYVICLEHASDTIGPFRNATTARKCARELNNWWMPRRSYRVAVIY